MRAMLPVKRIFTIFTHHAMTQMPCDRILISKLSKHFTLSLSNASLPDASFRSSLSKKLNLLHWNNQTATRYSKYANVSSSMTSDNKLNACYGCASLHIQCRLILHYPIMANRAFSQSAPLKFRNLRWQIFGDFFASCISVSHVQHISDMHSKFALRPHHVWKYSRHSICDRWD